jgi:cytochrome c oxidase assembly protein subunit 15
MLRRLRFFRKSSKQQSKDWIPEWRTSMAIRHFCACFHFLLHSPGVDISNMNTSDHPGRSFSLFAKLIVFVGLLLIWWGAATTTKQAGMIFADWPLSMGTINPPGWLNNMIPFLEHSHRLLAKLVGILVLILFSWSYIRSGKKALEVVALVFWLAFTLGVFIAAGAERMDASRKQTLLWIALGLAVVPLAWLIWSWRKRGWNLIQKLSALALLMVTTQAILGGLRVTEISDGFAVFHGCFAQIFFCVLILIALVSGKSWNDLGYVDLQARLRLTKRAGGFLIVLVGLQLIFGATMRHFHRSGLVDTDLLKTQGQWIPDFADPIVTVLFLHKFTAVCVLLFAVGLLIWLAGGRKSSDGRAVRGVAWIVGLILAQIALGLTVIGTGKSFWVTNVHVLNGLAILALSFVFSVKAWRGVPFHGSLANSGS